MKQITDSGGRAKAITADVSSEDQAREMVLAANTEFGRLDIVVNNAGLICWDQLGTPTRTTGGA